MDNEFETYDLFARYFNNELSVEEIASFEKELNTNSSFQQAFDEYKFSQELLVTQELVEVQDILDSFEYPISTPNTPFYKHKLFFIGLGVSILTIGSLASSLILPKHTKETNNLDLNTPSIVSTPSFIKTKKTDSLPIEDENIHTPSSLPKDTFFHTKQAQDISHDSIMIRNNNTQSLHKDFITQSKVDSVSKKDIHAKSLATSSVTKQEITSKSTPCQTIDIQYNLTESCEGNENGKIEIIQSKNGTAPYQYALNNKEWIDNKTYENLESGTYTLFVKDKNDCESQKKIAILEKKCYPNIYYIIPSQGIEWKIPFDDGKITIMNKRGNLIHELVLENGTENIWDGNTSNGFLKAGLYVFYIENSTGELLLKGKLSIHP